MLSERGTPKAVLSVNYVFIYYACFEAVCMLLLKIRITWSITLH